MRGRDTSQRSTCSAKYSPTSWRHVPSRAERSCPCTAHDVRRPCWTAAAGQSRRSALGEVAVWGRQCPKVRLSWRDGRTLISRRRNVTPLEVKLQAVLRQGAPAIRVGRTSVSHRRRGCAQRPCHCRRRVRSQNPRSGQLRRPDENERAGRIPRVSWRRARDGGLRPDRSAPEIDEQRAVPGQAKDRAGTLALLEAGGAREAVGEGT